MDWLWDAFMWVQHSLDILTGAAILLGILAFAVVSATSLFRRS